MFVLYCSIYSILWKSFICQKKGLPVKLNSLNCKTEIHTHSCVNLELSLPHKGFCCLSSTPVTGTLTVYFSKSAAMPLYINTIPIPCSSLKFAALFLCAFEFHFRLRIVVGCISCSGYLQFVWRLICNDIKLWWDNLKSVLAFIMYTNQYLLLVIIFALWMYSSVMCYMLLTNCTKSIQLSFAM